MAEGTETPVVHISVPGHTKSLALLRKIVTHVATIVGFPDHEVDKIEIAVDEACTNAMEHAYRTLTPPPPVILNIHTSEDALTVDIIDQGKAFDFESYIPPRFPDHWDAGHTRGVGLYLILHCMDDMSYEQLEDNSNRLRLVKHRNGACSASA